MDQRIIAAISQLPQQALRVSGLPHNWRNSSSSLNRSGMVPDKTKTDSKYVEYLLQFFQKRLQALGEGAAQHNTNLKTFETEYFPFPQLSNQTEVVNRLDLLHAAVDELAEKYQTKLQDLDDLRQSLLQKAFAGELT